MTVPSWLVAALIALVVTNTLTPGLRRFARRIGVIDYPGGRRINVRPMPRLGGIAIYIGFLAALLVAMVITRDIVLAHRGDVLTIRIPLSPRTDQAVLGILLGSTLLFLVGIWDDARGPGAAGPALPHPLGRRGGERDELHRRRGRARLRHRGDRRHDPPPHGAGEGRRGVGAAGRLPARQHARPPGGPGGPHRGPPLSHRPPLPQPAADLPAGPRAPAPPPARPGLEPAPDGPHPLPRQRLLRRGRAGGGRRQPHGLGDHPGGDRRRALHRRTPHGAARPEVSGARHSGDDRAPRLPSPRNDSAKPAPVDRTP